MRVTSKGQVTIPKEIRDHLEIQPGSEVDFMRKGDGSVELVGLPSSPSKKAHLRRMLETWAASVKGTGEVKLSSDEIMGMTRGRDGVSG
jgi:AbrB family looped-hinge helix DNA binding protein